MAKKPDLLAALSAPCLGNTSEALIGYKASGMKADLSALYQGPCGSEHRSRDERSWGGARAPTERSDKAPGGPLDSLSLAF